MKNYSCSWPISYDVTSLICYFQGQRIDHATFKFLILRGAGFKMHRIFRASNIICEEGVDGSTIFKVIRIIQFVQANDHLFTFSNLLVLSTSSWESIICILSSVPIIEFSSLSVYIPLFNTIFSPILSNTLL